MVPDEAASDAQFAGRDLGELLLESEPARRRRFPRSPCGFPPAILPMGFRLGEAHGGEEPPERINLLR